MAKVIGRPSEYRPEYCRQVIECMSEGLSLTAFAGSLPVARTTVHDWMRVHADFADAVTRGKAARVLWLEQKLLRSRKGAETSAAIFALKNAEPGEWRDMRSVEHKHSLDVTKLTDAQLHAIAAGVSPSDAGVIEGEAERISEK